MTFEMWRAEVDRIVTAELGLGLSDIEDYPYREWYENGKSAKGVARKVVKSAKMY